MSDELIGCMLVTVWGRVVSGGDGSVYPYWYLTESEAEAAEEEDEDRWGESSVFRVETFEGSNIHIAASEGRRYAH